MVSSSGATRRASSRARAAAPRHWSLVALIALACGGEDGRSPDGAANTAGGTGATTGGAPAGGTSTGGVSTGGAGTGGAATGGVTTGGAIATGGDALGGDAAGGAGGQPASGGAGGTPETGGAATGGASTGGTSPDGGAGTGGAGTGGASTGGTALGGAALGGNAGAATGGTAGAAGAGDGGTPPTGGASPGGAGAAGAPVGPFCELPDTLRAAGDCTGRLVGAALSQSHLGEPAYAAAAREHSYVTCENEMKWGSIEPNRGQFQFGPADQIVAFAQDNGMRIKGHALVWHNQLPSWVQNLTSADDARAAMLDHIAAVVGRYRGEIEAWDVVNEVWQNEETWVGGEPALRDYVFTRLLGDSFIDEAYYAAHEADPAAKLYYNDYRAEGLNAKSDAIYGMVRGMVERGVPLDGVGLQMHQGAPNGVIPVAEIVANMQRLADLGLEVVISEMDIHRCAGQTPEEQRQEFHDIVAACVAQPACPAITFWGLSDAYSWLQDEDDTGCAAGEDPAGLLWDASWNRKPAYYGVLDALTGR